MSEMTWVGLNELIDTNWVEIGRGKVISKNDLSDHPGNYPVYSSAALNNGQFGAYGEYMFDEELITWSVDGGGSFFYRPKHRFSVTNVGGFIRIKNHERVFCKYLYYALSFLHSKMTFDWTSKAHPSVIRRLYSNIFLPALSEQRRITAILDKADGLRAERREALAQLNCLGQSIFMDMFGDPVSNPFGWQKLKLEDLTNKVTDGEHLNPSFSDSGMPIIMAGNVLTDKIDLVSAKRVETTLGQKFRQKCGPEFGDLLIVGRGATIGRLCRVNTHESFCLMGSVILIKPKREILDEHYLSLMLTSSSMHAMLYNTSGSSAQQAIYLKDVKRLRCPVPPLVLQKTFATRLQSIETLKTTHRLALQEHNLLFASLQQKAFMGAL